MRAKSEKGYRMGKAKKYNIRSNENYFLMDEEKEKQRQKYYIKSNLDNTIYKNIRCIKKQITQIENEKIQKEISQKFNTLVEQIDIILN